MLPLKKSKIIALKLISALLISTLAKYSFILVTSIEQNRHLKPNKSWKKQIHVP